jgi:AcrR family transcriptional regulator
VNDKLRRRENLLRIAREVFARKGYHQTKVDDIARAARVAKGTLYLYFPDKSSIMQELLDRIVVVLQGAILHVDPQGDLPAQIKHNIRAIVGVFLDDPTLTKILLSPQTGGDPDFQRRLGDFMQTVTDILAKAMADGQDLGIVAPGQPSLQASFALGGLKEVLMHATREGATREIVVGALYDMLSVGLLRLAGRTGYERITAVKSTGPLRKIRPGTAG